MRNIHAKDHEERENRGYNCDIETKIQSSQWVGIYVTKKIFLVGQFCIFRTDPVYYLPADCFLILC